MRCQWCCILESAWMSSTGGDWVMPSHIAVVFIFLGEIWEFPYYLETHYCLFQLSRKALKALRKIYPRFISHHLWGTSPRSKLWSPPGSVYLIAWLSSPSLRAVWKRRGALAEAENTQPCWREGALPVHLIPRLVEKALLLMCTGTGINNAHQDIGFSELDCTVLCFKISLVLLN